MAGALSKALLKHGNPLAPIGEAVASYLKRKDDERKQEEFLNSLSGLQSEISGLYQPKNTLDVSYQPSNLGNKLMDTTKRLSLGSQTGLQQGIQPNIPEMRNVPNFEQRQVPVNYNQANQKATDRKASFLVEQLRNKVNPELINTGLNIADSIKQSRQPKERKVETANPEYDLIYGDTGEVIRKGTPKQEKPENRYERTETINVNGKPVIRGLIKGTNEWEDIGEQYYQPQKAPVINMPKPEKWGDFGNLISEARVTKVYDKNADDGKGGMVSLEPEEINQKWDKAKNGFKSRLLPKAKLWFENEIEKKKFERISDKAYLNKIADAVEKDELTLEEAQDLVDANAFRADLYGEKNVQFTSPKK